MNRSDGLGLYCRQTVGRLLGILGARRIGIALLATAVIAAGPASTAPTTVRVGLYENKPKIFTDENGSASGIFIDLIRDIGAEEGWSLVFVPCQWADCLAKLESGDIDLMPDVAYSEERDKKFDFHKTPVLESWSQVYAASGLEVNGYEDLSGRRVAILKGSIQQTVFEQNMKGFGFDVTIVEAGTLTEAFQLAADGSADAAIANNFFGDYFYKEYSLRKTPIVFDPAALYFATAQGRNAGLLEAVDRRLNAWIAEPNSPYYTALSRWTEAAPVYHIPQSVYWGIGVAGVFLAAAVGWILMLRRQVRTRTKHLRQVNRTLRMIGECNRALVRASGEEDLLNAVCGILVDTGGYRMSWVGLAEPDEAKTVRPIAQRGFEDGYLQTANVTWADSECGRGPTGTAIRTGKPVAARRILTDPAFGPWRRDALQRGYASSIALPLMNEGRAFGAMMAYASEPDAFSPSELDLLAELAEDLAYGLVMFQKKAEFRATEEKAKQAADLVQALSRYANDFIILLDDQFRFLEVNERLVDTYEYTRAELIGMQANKLRAPDTKDDFEQQIRKSQEFGTSLYETIHQRKDGSTFPVEVNLHAIRSEGRQFFQAVIRDITERKEHEKALTESERKYRELVEHANSIILRWTRDGVITFLNEYGLRFFGYTPEEIIGRPVMGTLVPSTESDGRDLRELMEKILSDPQAFEQNINENIRRDGERVWIAWTNRIVKDADGRAVEVLSIGTDITERKHADEAIRELNATLERRVEKRTAELAVAKDRAEAADRLKSAFLATMSHELRTPLNSIIGFTGIILQELAGPLTAEQNKQLTMVRDSARHLLALINDVLDISKIEAGQLEVHPEPFDLRASLEKIIGIIRPLAEKKGLTLETRLAPEIGTFDSDTRRVEQIVINLLNNAVKFTDRGGITLDAGFAPYPYHAPKNVLRISVTDTGIGIKPEELETLFQPFHQIDSGLTRQHEGTGLGLAICRRLAGLLGGEIHVESKWGKGSTFALVLPVKESRSQ